MQHSIEKTHVASARGTPCNFSLTHRGCSGSLTYPILVFRVFCATVACSGLSTSRRSATPCAVPRLHVIKTSIKRTFKK